jgi:peptide deformylase
MIRKIVSATDPILRIKAKPISKLDKKVVSLIKDLKETLVAQKDPEGVGLAACQIGKSLRVFVMLQGKTLKTILNPEIITVSEVQKQAIRDKTKIMEGCLSLPNLYGPLKRATTITIKYMDENGKSMTETFEGFDAQIIQHEIDHLEGKLFIDKLVEQAKPLFEYKNGEWERVEII